MLIIGRSCCGLSSACAAYRSRLMIRTLPPERYWLDRLVCRCQLLAGRPVSAEPSLLMRDTSELVDDVPASITASEQVIARGLLAQMLSRAVATTGINPRSEIADRLLAFAAVGWSAAAWRTEWNRLTDCCVATIAQANRRDQAGTDARVRRVLEIIEEHYNNPRLTFRDVAKDVSVSTWYLGRMLRRQTGSGFLVHLHRQRVTIARHLLTETVLSAKEIASVVGYSPGQLSRHFKAAYRITPVRFRAAGVKST